MIHIENINFTFDMFSPFPKHIFVDTYMNLEGNKVLLQAESGAGKSTLFSLLIGYYKGLKVNKDIRLLLQNIESQILCETIYDEINLGYKIKYKRDMLERDVVEILEKFEIYKDISFDPNKLSGGQKKMVIIIALVVCEPEILILDEPYVSLDNKHINILNDFLRETDQKFILSTHIVYEDFYDQKITIINKKIVGIDE